MGLYIGSSNVAGGGSVTDSSVAAFIGAGGPTDTALSATIATVAARRLKRRDLAPSRLLSRQVATTAPTVTISSTSLVGKPTVQYDAVTSGALTLTGGAGWAHPTNGWNAAAYWRTDRAPDVNGLTLGASKVMFNCDAAQVEVQFYFNPSATYRVKVDDQYLSTTAQAPGVSGATRFLQLDFTAVGGAKVRRIVIETTAQVIGASTTATGTIWPAPPRGPRTVFFGDSYTGGSNGNGAAFTTWYSMVSDLLGWEDTFNNAVGSTGYLQTVSGYANAAPDHVTAAITAGVVPDVVVGTWGHNDVDTDANIATRAASVFQQMRTAWPNAALICGGPFYVGGTITPSQSSREAAIFAAVGSLADGFIPQASGAGTPWFTGSGKAGATTGSGNSDLYVYSDGVHPTQAGHDYLGTRMAAAIRAILAA